MCKDLKDMPIGFFDSGVGGVSVLKEAIELLPNESFIYFGDNGNAPYGTKPKEIIKKFSMNAAAFLVNKGVKALVVACNTATSAAIKDMRQKFDIPIIGMEPALKPAVHIRDHGKIIVMATPATLRQEKFQNLLNQYRKDNEVISLPCPGLVEIIEDGHLDDYILLQYLENLLGTYKVLDVDVVVLGCTHYVFIKKQINDFFMNDVRVIDGNHGTVKQLMHVLQEASLLYSDEKEKSYPNISRIQFYTSGNQDEVIALFNMLLRRK